MKVTNFVSVSSRNSSPFDKIAAILAGDILKWIFLNENGRTPIQISLIFVPRSWIGNNPVLVEVMAWHRTGDKPLPTYICGTRGIILIWCNLDCIFVHHYAIWIEKQRNTSYEYRRNACVLNSCFINCYEMHIMIAKRILHIVIWQSISAYN